MHKDSGHAITTNMFPHCGLFKLVKRKEKNRTNYWSTSIADSSQSEKELVLFMLKKCCRRSAAEMLTWDIGPAVDLDNGPIARIFREAAKAVSMRTVRMMWHFVLMASHVTFPWGFEIIDSPHKRDRWPTRFSTWAVCQYHVDWVRRGEAEGGFTAFHRRSAGNDGCTADRSKREEKHAEQVFLSYGWASFPVIFWGSGYEISSLHQFTECPHGYSSWLGVCARVCAGVCVCVLAY